MLHIMTFKVVIANTASCGRECSFSFKTEHPLPNEEVWKLAARNVHLQLKRDEYMEALMFEGCTTE